MKGIIFTEFLDHVTSQLGVEICEDMIAANNLTDGGAYTAVGTYDHKELLMMVSYLHKRTGIDIDQLIEGFGVSLFASLAQKYPSFFDGIEDSFTFIKQIEDVIHVEVRKLYPDAELPSFSYSQPKPTILILDYRSSRCFAGLAVGLMKGCFNHFNENVSIDGEDLADPKGSYVRFTLRSVM
ncbi:heme NO-binding domain-containing protein [Algisphaera agarilytica]|uniref:Heme NO-binding domain-containing protein n=1 Tax=Algisphaera agarilytica TaxID=1385975 RepID=A0A7X0LJ66_9BACT|nr:heme NO-binding domain-containing protein [Algisphaera agarilytica]MBB6428281.1 hypothetical protein [Algisphaera agarilytica]